MKLSVRDEETVLEVIDLCAALEGQALEFYENLALLADGEPMRALWAALAADERGHKTYWLRLKELCAVGGAPEMFDEPRRYVDELRALQARVEHLAGIARQESQVPRVFIHALKLEFLLLHPAIVTLFHYLPESPGEVSPSRTYGTHLGKLLGALMDYGQLPPELDLLGEAIGQLWKKTEESATKTVTDQVTGSLNRRGLYIAMKPLAFLARREKQAVGVMVLEVANIKEIRFGHRVGDETLATVAAAIASRLRASDVIGRFGGDDFLAFLTRFDPPQFGRIGVEVAERVAAKEIAGARPKLIVGGAWTMISGDVKDDLDALIRAADNAVVEARQGGMVCRVGELVR
jgi:diguanylate cyclase (GGDEF)-like protein